MDAELLTPESWWCSCPPRGFTELAWSQVRRMNRSKFANVVILSRGPTVASAWELARQRKRETQSSSYSASAMAS